MIYDYQRLRGATGTTEREGATRAGARARSRERETLESARARERERETLITVLGEEMFVTGAVELLPS